MERPTTAGKLTKVKNSGGPNDPGQPSQPQRSQTALRQALPALHLPGRHHHNHHEKHKDKRHGDRHPFIHGAVHSPANVPSAIAEMFGSSRTNLKSGQTPEDSTAASEKEAAPIKLPEREVRPIDIAKERHRRVRREEELKSTLDSLSDLASSSTRRVDMLFMGLKEKLGTLQSIIQKLQELSTESSRMREEFESEAMEIETDFEGQVNAFKGFDNQQHSVESLRSRIEMSVRKSEDLQARLKHAREQVSDWEKREDEWQASTSMKLRIGWACFGALVGLVILGAIVHTIFFRTGTPPIAVRAPVNASDMESLWRELSIARPPGRPKSMLGQDRGALSNDPRLRVLDEL